ncbi:MAG: hypothetical protein MUF21_15245 [Gemmatimonadaceae bacterium]|nr:hypothetical protein [Gemmatimonadaceae bacterium]
MVQNEDASRSPGAAPEVRVAIGWTTRDVIARSDMPVTFPDDDRSSEIIESTPSRLTYVDSAHGFTLPPGRLLWIDQAAGRIYAVRASPHLEALSDTAAVALATAIIEKLEQRGWTRQPAVGSGPAGAVARVAEFAASGQPGFGPADIGEWRVPRSTAAHAQLPPAPPSRNRYAYDGLHANLSVAALASSKQPGAPLRLVMDIKVSDDLMRNALSRLMESRRARLGGGVGTLRSWELEPNEPPPTASAAPR